MKLSEIRICNSNKSNTKCSITANNNTTYVKNTNEAVKEIIRLLGTTSAADLMSANDLHTDEELAKYLTDYVNNLLSNKAAANLSKNINRNLTFKSKNLAVNIKTINTFNNLDDVLLSVLRYCKEDNNIYVLNNKSLTMLGSISNIVNNAFTLNATRVLHTAMRNKISAENNRDFVDLESYLRYKATEASNYAKSLITAFQLSLPDNYTSAALSAMQVEQFDGSTKSYEEIAGYDNEQYTDVLLTHAYKTLINELMPSGIISCKLAKIQPTFVTADDGTLTSFVRFSIERCKEDRAITFQNYVVQLFSNDTAQLLDRLQCIDEVPYIISDDERNAELYINNANIPTTYSDEHPRFDAFTAPYTKEELRVLLAWCYTILHPSCNEHIMLLLQTSGGTGKTTYWAKMLQYWLKKLYGENLVLQLKHSDITDKDKREPVNSRGFTNAALVVVDECESKITDFIKAYSGSKRISYTSNVKYERSFSTLISARFMLLTNKEFQIEDASSAFDRRLIVLKHFESNNLWKNLPAGVREDDVADEADFFYVACKTAYTAIKKEFNSLYEAKEAVDTIKRNEEEMTSNSDFALIYSNIYNTRLKDSNADHLCISVKELDTLFATEAVNNGISEKSAYFFKKWIKENHFVKMNYVKHVYVGDHRNERRYFLHKLIHELDSVVEPVKYSNIEVA